MIKDVLEKYKERIPVRVLAELLADIDEAEAKFGCHAICYLDSPCEYQNEDIRVVEEAECCEWKKYEYDILFPYKTSCGHSEVFFDTFKYCPYCGKKIKISEVE